MTRQELMKELNLIGEFKIIDIVDIVHIKDLVEFKNIKKFIEALYYNQLCIDENKVEGKWAYDLLKEFKESK